MKFETRAVHAGGAPDPTTGAIAPPIHLSTTFEHGPAGRDARAGTCTSARAIRRRRGSRRRSPRSRAGRRRSCSPPAWPPARRISRRFPPGRTSSSRTTSTTASARSRRSSCRGGGWSRPRVDMADLAACARRCGPNTRLIWAETPSNPLMKVVDLAALAAIAHEAGARLIVDGTFATPALQRPLELGADVVAALDDEVPRRAQRRAGRRRDPPRARRDWPRRSSTSATSSAPSPRPSTRGSCCAGCARSSCRMERHSANGARGRAGARGAPGRRGGALSRSRVASRATRSRRGR